MALLGCKHFACASITSISTFSLIGELTVYHSPAFFNKLRTLLKGWDYVLLMALFSEFLNSTYSIIVK